ncbi:hypothetical protein ACFPRL_01960 [Pseudoclavibacter helvolus]
MATSLLVAVPASSSSKASSCPDCRFSDGNDSHPAHGGQLEDEPGSPPGHRVHAEARLGTQGCEARLRRRRGRDLPSLHGPS